MSSSKTAKEDILDGAASVQVAESKLVPEIYFQASELHPVLNSILNGL